MLVNEVSHHTCLIFICSPYEFLSPDDTQSQEILCGGYSLILIITPVCCSDAVMAADIVVATAVATGS